MKTSWKFLVTALLIGAVTQGCSDDENNPLKNGKATTYSLSLQCSDDLLSVAKIECAQLQTEGEPIVKVIDQTSWCVEAQAVEDATSGAFYHASTYPQS